MSGQRIDYELERQGRAAIRLEGLPDAERPQLTVRPGLDAKALVLGHHR